MRIEKADYTIRITLDEVRDIAYCMKHDLLDSIERHYNCLQQNQDGEPVFDDLCKEKVRLLTELSNITGERIVENFKYVKNKMFEDKRIERSKNAKK